MSIAPALIALLHPRQKGQGLVEYALILSLTAIVAIASLVFLGGQISSILGEIGSSV